MSVVKESHALTILLVANDLENIDFLRTTLASLYTLNVVTHGDRALRICGAIDPPSLVLLDVMVEGVDGYEICRTLKSDPCTKNIPVIFVTSKGNIYDELLGFQVGAVDFIHMPINAAVMLARVQAHMKLSKTLCKLASAHHFMRETFGRYLSDEVVTALVDTPDGLRLGGDKRELTIVISDLRGFTSISERLSAEIVVDMLNIYLDEMTSVIQKHLGTINEFIGDAILVVFGAPVGRQDDAMRAVCCAVEMQLMMEKVNSRYQEKGYPQVKMGIGINTGSAIVGNIGSAKRSKYAVVGMVVNLASRIESYTIGGQILISERTRICCKLPLRIDDEIKVMPKGVHTDVTLYEIGGVYGEQPLMLAEKISEPLVELITPIDVQISLLEGKFSRDTFPGTILRLNHLEFELALEQDCATLSSLKILLPGCSAGCYVKVVRTVSVEPIIVQASITYMSEVVKSMLHKWLLNP
ncbi:MAG: adenylate/guanylate cyclase domain-containing protein [Mariprofundus sp.]|nr:adenylate/guanylate cyclase domain-containing protein [Mariprofundus sp.]